MEAPCAVGVVLHPRRRSCAIRLRRTRFPEKVYGRRCARRLVWFPAYDPLSFCDTLKRSLGDVAGRCEGRVTPHVRRERCQLLPEAAHRGVFSRRASTTAAQKCRVRALLSGGMSDERKTSGAFIGCPSSHPRMPLRTLWRCPRRAAVHTRRCCASLPLSPNPPAHFWRNGRARASTRLFHLVSCMHPVRPAPRRIALHSSISLSAFPSYWQQTDARGAEDARGRATARLPERALRKGEIDHRRTMRVTS